MSDLHQPNRDTNTVRREDQWVMETRVWKGTKSTGSSGGGGGGERWPELGQAENGGSHNPNGPNYGLSWLSS